MLQISLLGIMHATSPLAKYPLISSYRSKRCLAKRIATPFTNWFTIYFYCGWTEDVSFQSPIVRPRVLFGTLFHCPNIVCL